MLNQLFAFVCIFVSITFFWIHANYSEILYFVSLATPSCCLLGVCIIVAVLSTRTAWGCRDHGWSGWVQQICQAAMEAAKEAAAQAWNEGFWCVWDCWFLSTSWSVQFLQWVLYAIVSIKAGVVIELEVDTYQPTAKCLKLHFFNKALSSSWGLPSCVWIGSLVWVGDARRSRSKRRCVDLTAGWRESFKSNKLMSVDVCLLLFSWHCFITSGGYCRVYVSKLQGVAWGKTTSGNLRTFDFKTFSS